MSDVFKIASGNPIYYQVETIKTSLTGAVISDYSQKTIDITTIQDKYANRFHHNVPPTGS